MSKDVLGLALAQVVIDAASTPPSGDQLANIKQFWTDFADAVITHIQTMGQVSPGIPVSTAGGPAAQTGATTGPGTIT
jgi:hypothetical protein